MLNLLNALAVSFDLPILEWIQNNLHSAFMDTIMPIITLFGEAGIFWIAWAVLLMILPKHRRTGAAMGMALIMGLVVCNMILKPAVGRIRPYDFQMDVLNKKDFSEFIAAGRMLVEAQHDFSFPSGHTIASFEAASVLMIRNKKMGIPALILAILVSFSRLYLYVHYPSDVLVSVVLGTLFGIIACWAVKKIAEKLPEKYLKHFQ